MWTDTEHRRSMHLPLLPVPDLQARAREVEDELRNAVEGEVRFDTGSRALYAADASNYRQVPIGVVVPRTVADVVAAVGVCHQYGLPVLSRGAGTSLAGECCNVAVVLDFSKYLRGVLSFHPDRRLVSVHPGTVLDDLRHEVQRRAGLTFGPDPSTHAYCTIGGMIGNDSCGVHAQMAGRTSQNLHSLEVLTYDGLRLRVGATSDDALARFIREGGRKGEIYGRLKALRDRYGDAIRQGFPRLTRRVSGYNNLDQLLPENGFHVARALSGTEGTCVTVLEATLELIPFKPHAALAVLGYPDVFAAADHLEEVLRFNPIALEGIDDKLTRDITRRHLHPKYLRELPEGKGWLIVQFWADSRAEARQQAADMVHALGRRPGAPNMRVLDQAERMDELWKVREAGLGATARLPDHPDSWPGWEDSAVPPDKVHVYLPRLRKLFEKYGYDAALYGHFGQGCIHCRIDFDLSSRAGLDKYRAFVNEAADLVLGLGGSLSGEHGDGQARAELLPKMYGPELMQAFREFKAIWDPQNRMNPGKVIDAYRLDENLRFGTDYRPAQPDTHFRFPEDQGHFFRATERCVGVGKCRRTEEGTMCPSYQVTREEKHSTRGRAHMLFEMLNGDTITSGWKSEAVKESLDLCLACKGCKGDCPMQVDMATYKAEFLSHYYEGRLRPRSAYAFGLIYWWARLGSKVPNLVNFVTHVPGLRALAKWAAGMPQAREVPAFAPQTFKDWFFAREAKNPEGTPVVLWPDTFNNHFHPQVAKAAVEVLEAAGFRVTVPRASLCCGRPLYDYGFLDQAKRQLRQILGVLKPALDEGTPVVGLEPSCVSVLRDELVSLFPDDPDAQKLARQTFLLSELLTGKAPHFAPKLEGHAVVHGHCHHKSVLGFDDEKGVLDRLGLQHEVLDSGCCGMAGSFGFEKDRYDVSVKVGERVLLPKVREARAEALVVTDGFSCREQIEQLTDRRALHLAELLQLALHGGAGGRPYPERRVVPSREDIVRRSILRVSGWLALTAGLAAAALVWRRGRPA